MRKFLIQNFGCRASQADGAALATQLLHEGYQPATAAGQAELVILNTCTVTAAADQDVRHAVRRARRNSPGARILVTGCYAQRAPQELAALPGVAWVIGNSHKFAIPEILAAQRPSEDFHGEIRVANIFEQLAFALAPLEQASDDRTRPNLKIQDGCNNRCSFCIIPSVRGRSRSAPAEAVLAQIRQLAARYREVVLSGINLGRWGRDLDGRPRLAGLLQRILAETPVERIRLSSLEPMDWSGELLHLMASSERIARHVHMPLQSGSDAVLRRMRRRYRSRHYAERLTLARRLMPDAAIGADVMVGFPGESGAEFEESRRFIDAMPFTYLHVFTYSERPGTPAAGAPHQVPLPVRKQRNRILRELAARKNLAFRQSMLGKTCRALTLGDGLTALTSNYLTVELAFPRQPNHWTQLRIGALTPDRLAETTPFPLWPAPPGRPPAQSC